jgi:penicillin-binding protein 1A
VAGTMTKMLQEAVAEGTGEAAQLPGWKPAGKTGTTQENADAWFVGVVPTLSVATWLGRPDAAQPVRGLTGGSAAASVWREFMATAIEDVEPAPFPEPPRRLDPAEEPPSLPEARRVRER